MTPVFEAKCHLSYALRHSDSTLSIQVSRNWYVYCGNRNMFRETETKFPFGSEAYARSTWQFELNTITQMNE